MTRKTLREREVARKIGPRKPEPIYPDRCPYCSFDPTSMNDYCDEHRHRAASRKQRK